MTFMFYLIFIVLFILLAFYSISIQIIMTLWQKYQGLVFMINMMQNIWIENSCYQTAAGNKLDAKMLNHLWDSEFNID